jgi:hypothetical protein
MERKRKRQSDVEFWTAAKCQRLLRPITSRIAPLRRNQYTLNSELSQSVVEEESLPGFMSQNIARREAPLTNIHTTSLDPTWLPPTQNNKSQLKKYSARHRDSQRPSSHTHSPQACLVLLPTPFKARALRRGTPLKNDLLALDTSNSPCAPRNLPLARRDRQRKDPFTRAPVAKQSVELQGRQNYERTFELHQGVTDGFSLLLQRTTSTDSAGPSVKGVSSLLSMCLRRVPDYIRAEEDWRKDIDENDEIDVSAEVYEELEDLGSVHGHGWPGLREIVIAHGMSLIHEIIKDKLVSTETRAELARIPAKYGLNKASENLLLAYAQSLPLKQPLGVDSRLFDGCLSSLTIMQPANAKNEVFVRLLDALFSSGRLKLSWLATRDMVNLSTGMIRALASRSGESGNIIRFLQGRISQISRAELVQEDVDRKKSEGNLNAWRKLDKSLDNTIVSIVTVLTAIVLIERNTRDSSGSSEKYTAAGALLARLSVIVLTTLEALEHERSTSLSDQHAVCFSLLASSMILSVKHTGEGKEQTSPSKEDILHGMAVLHGKGNLSNARTIVERAASFLVDLSRCCGQSLHSDSQTYLEGLVRSILEEAEHGSDKEKTFLKQWAMESSLLSVKMSATRRSRTFLSDIEAAMTRPEFSNIRSTDMVSYHVGAPTVEPVLRWEEGLCEWIVASPLRTRKSNRSIANTNRNRSTSDTSKQDSDLNDSGYLSEVKETPTLQRKSINMSNMLASPDVLGFDLEMPLRLNFEDRTKAQKTMTVPWETSPTIQYLQHSTSQRMTSDTVKAVAETSKVGTHSVLCDVHADVAARPAKKRKSRVVREPMSETSSLVLTASQQSSKQELHNLVEEHISDPSESDMDELAMSCSKRRGRPSMTRRRVGPRESRVKNLPLAKRASSQFVDISDDELGF